MANKHKKRVELQFNMENAKERELIEFIDQNATTRAGFIKSVLRQYMNVMQSMGTTGLHVKSTQSKPQLQQKRVPKLGASFSTKDFE